MFSQHVLAAAALTGLFASAAAQADGCVASTNASTVETNLASTESSVGAGCCATLANSAIGSRLVLPSDASYTARIEIPWSLGARLEPRCIILPQSGEEVGRAVSALVDANRNQTCHFAVRSGGHTNWPEAANIEYGVLLDLGYLNSTTYHPENQTASVQPGARWGSVYETVLAEGVLVAGGRDPGVGVGGFLLGGGNSFYASARGYACDNVANFHVVLANGTLVDANAENNADLFTALKGGSSNMGIVIRFDLMTWPAEDLWGGVVVYDWSTASRQIEALVDYAENVHTNPDSSAIVFFQDSFSSNDTAVINVYTSTKPVVRPPIFDKFLAIPSNLSDTTRTGDLANMVNELAQPDGLRDTFLTLTVKADAETMEKIVSLHRDLVTKIRSAKPIGNWTISTLFQPIPSLFGQHAVENGGNVIGLDRFDDDLMLYQLYLAWEGAEQDDLFNNAGGQTVKDVKSASVALGTDNPFIYLNYADRTQAPLEGYGSDAVAKIRAASAKYDPNGVFQNLVPSGFKVSLVDGKCAVDEGGEGQDGQGKPGSAVKSTLSSGSCVMSGVALLSALMYLL